MNNPIKAMKQEIALMGNSISRIQVATPEHPELSRLIRARESLVRAYNLLVFFDTLAYDTEQAWKEGYEQGIDDERQSAALDYIYPPRRQNPYRLDENGLTKKQYEEYEKTKNMLDQIAVET